MIYAKSLNQALLAGLQQDPRVVVLGEDIADPYGGAFKVTRGLTSHYPDRVKTTPVSEGALAGVSAGLALSGYRPITEVMFGDFLTLCFDQLVNHISKYEAMYAGAARCPVMIRSPSGGHRGYGPTHSQSLEKHFLGIPHLNVISASLRHDPADVVEYFLKNDQPVLFVEHKLLYPQHLFAPKAGRAADFLAAISSSSDRFLPTVSLSLVPREECSVTVLAYGYQAHLAERVIENLALEHEIFAELLIPAHISPIDWAPIETSVNATRRLVTIEEGTAGWSWGSEIAAVISKRLFGVLEAPVEVVASDRTVIPSARHLEEKMLVGEQKIARAIREIAS